MPNLFNILAGILSMIGTATLAYATWTPAMSFLNYFSTTDTTLWVVSSMMYIGVIAIGMIFFPLIMLISDDSG